MATIEYIEYSPKRKDLAGHKFPHITVLFYAYTENFKTCWYCLCECGRTKVIDHGHLMRNPETRRCGICIRRGGTHGMSSSITYVSWKSMLKRCYYPSAPATSKRNYQEKGITVCDEWRESFENFFADMGERPPLAYTIDRKDNTLGYFKDNCRWATRSEQMNNSSHVHLITYQDQTHSIREWAEILGHSEKVLYWRLKRWTIERSFTTPLSSHL